MPEVVGAFSSTEPWHERTDRSVETGNSALGDLAEQRLEVAVGHLDGIEIGRVLRQVAERGPRLLNRFSDSRNLVGLQIIHHDNVVAPKCWSQALLDVGSEYISGHGAFDHHRCDHFVVSQAGHEGDPFPISERNTADQSDASGSPPPEADQIGADRSLVDKYQASGIKHALFSHPTSPGAHHVCPFLFRRPQAFFLRVMSCRSRNRQSELRLVRIRCLRSSAKVSSKVKSGCSATRANIRSANSSSGETLPPRGFGAALPTSRQRCSHLTDELALLSKRSAASRREAPVSTASITRSRKSPE